MTIFLWNILLAIAWAALTGRLTPANLLIGFGLSYLILLYVQRITGPSNYFVKVRQVIGFVLFFLWELILANLRVAHDVVTPTHHMRPGVIAIPLDAQTDVEITLLANVITLTPGTLSLDVSSDRRVLYIHAMYIDDMETLRASIKDGFERRTLEVLR
jgi:multicomponent Na+:H+ antiporter subunit E